jgi:hypothetical protein
MKPDFFAINRVFSFVKIGFMKSIPAFVLALLLLSACGDDSEEINYSGTYVSTSIETTSVRTFTKKGEVKKSGVIDEFLPEAIASDYFIFANPPDVAGEISVEFLEDSLINITEYGHTDTKALTRKGGIFYLESLDTGTILGGASQGFPLAELLTYKPLYTDTTLIAPGSGYSYMVEVKECVYLESSGSEIRMPILSYYYKNTNLHGGGGSTYAARQNNSLNKNSLKKLSATDTIVVQQIYIALRKQ